MDLYVTESGLFGAPMVLFLHGSPLSSKMWQPQFESMSDFHNVAPDFPGHGQSAAITHFTRQEVVETLIQLIRQTSPNGKTHLVAFSSGTMIAQALMVAAPQLLDRVVLFDASFSMSRLWALAHGINLAWLYFLKPERVGWMVSEQFGIPSETRIKYYEDFRQYSLSGYMQTWRTYTDIKIPSTAESPTLVVVGEKENQAMKKKALVLSHKLPNGRGIIVPQMGSGWILQQPELTNQIIRAWLTNHLLPAGLDPLE